MKVKVNDWVMRVGYPVLRAGFPQTFEDIPPNTAFLVTAINGEGITLQVIDNQQLKSQTFWAGNFLKVTLKPIIKVD